MAAPHKQLPLPSLLCILTLSSLTTTTTTTLLHPPSLIKQASTLLSIKQSFLNPNPFLQSWNSSNTVSLCSSWVAVLCDVYGENVVSVDLSGSNISGQIPPSIADLRSLRYLNISNNQLNGTLSSWNFFSMSKLEVFDAYNNDFSGDLPFEISKLRKLRHLDLGGNYFYGSIPASYGDFRELSYLSLAGNNLGGFIPRELGNITSLTQLYLGYYNDFDGGAPKELALLVNLSHLDLSSCGIEGEIPPEFGNFRNLDTLFLQTNQLVGEIPPRLGNLTRLKFLDLSNNALTGEIPGELSRLEELTLLNLFFNRLCGEIPGFVAEMPGLTILMLWENNFTGVIPEKLGLNAKLRKVDLSTNKLTGVIPRNLCYGKRLEVLILLDNFLFGPMPGSLGDCPTLSRVRLGQNYLTGSIPRGFLYSPELLVVELQNNYLAGEIEEDTEARPKKLGQLNLSNNRLSGTLPDSIGNFLGLQNLLLGGNRFSGEIPTRIGLLRNLLKMDLSRNNFSGGIPGGIGDCASLAYLDLSRNSLEGPIPYRISEIRILNYLNVSWNKLNQSIPKEIGSMKSLTSADFSHNEFSGMIPESGQFAYFNASSFVANPQLCGPSSNPCKPLQSNDMKSHLKIPGRFKLLFALGLLACSVIFAATAAIKTRSMMMSKRNSNSWKLTSFQKLEFGCDDIVECLKENRVIGRGGAGTVYRGTMPDGEQVAVKRLLGITNGSSHDNGFSAEIQILGKIRHRNIVRLLAFCSNKEMNLLVYEYMPNGSLGEVLHGKRGGYLNWERRLTIAIEAARGLCYLHHDCCPLILHRDVKSNNILLDGGFEAHVADFGLAKFLKDTGASECMSAIAGSYGYIAPEYAYTLKVDEKSDVYSYGVVLLELITGRKPVGDFEEEGVDLVQWARMNTDSNKEGVARIVDRRIPGVPMDEVMQVFFVAMLCVQERSIERPTMREVVQMLEQAKKPPPSDSRAR